MTDAVVVLAYAALVVVVVVVDSTRAGWGTRQRHEQERKSPQ